jgi:hypothetical protein
VKKAAGQVVFSRADIKAMSPEDYAKNSENIIAAQAAGNIIE